MNFLNSCLKSLRPRNDDDAVDRLSYYYTCLIILCLSITITAKQYVGQPIQCWVPPQFTSSWEQYAENYCFVQNTFWIPMREPIPPDRQRVSVSHVGYYQWVPFILAVEASLFYAPSLIWKFLNRRSGVHISEIVCMVADTGNIATEKRRITVRAIATHIKDALELHFDLTKSKYGLLRKIVDLGKSKGMYLTFLHIAVKLLYTANVIGQFFLLNACLSSGHHLWGLQVLNDLIHGREWEETGYFPRVTLCDFQVRTLGNLHYYTIQCVLMINMFNEKIFVFLWWWFFLIATASICSLLYSTFIYFSRKQQIQFVSRYLRITDCLLDFTDEGRKEVVKFLNRALCPDGVFILRMISWHGGDLITTEIIYFMWKSFTNHDTKRPMKLLRQPARGRCGCDCDHLLDEVPGSVIDADADAEKRDDQLVLFKKCAANHVPNYFSANLFHYLNKQN